VHFKRFARTPRSRCFSPLLGKKNGKARTAQHDPASEQKVDTAEKMLTVLRTFFNDDFIDFEERTKLWRVLTALRGPDDQDREAKTACMSLIRREVAGQTAYDFTMPFSRFRQRGKR
jgi:hypothetical protein